MALLCAQPWAPFRGGVLTIPFVLVLQFQFAVEFRAGRSILGRGGDVVVQFRFVAAEPLTSVGWLRCLCCCDSRFVVRMVYERRSSIARGGPPVCL